MNSPTWVITISGDRPIKEIASELKKKGLSSLQVLEEIGCIIGAASEKAASVMTKVKGVADVSRDVAMDVGPPDASIS